jgi:hypothetical protein
MASAESTTVTDEQRGTALTVLGMVAFSQLAAFSRLAADAAVAPSLGRRLELSRMSGVALARFEQISGRVDELGAELEAVMEPFAGMLTEFDERTPPSTWSERMLKAYVGYSVADDFYRVVVEPLEPVSRDLLRTVLAEHGLAGLVVDSLAEAVQEDPTLSARLALWGRRLVGEALTVVQRVLIESPDLRDLLVQAEDAAAGEAQTRLFATLTAEHSRRMERLGLTP